MARKGWLDAYGRDPEERGIRVKRFRRIRRWGLALLAVAVVGTVYLLVWEPPQTASDAFALAVALAGCLSAGFTLITKLETEIMLCELLDELKR